MKQKQEIEYPLKTRPGDGETLQVIEGVLWVRMPIPIPGLDYINLYLIEDDDGWTMVDSGFRSGRIKKFWEQIFASDLKGKPITRLICTHFHPDHMGLAGWVSRRWDIPLTMTMGEWTFGRMLTLESSAEVPDEVLAFYHAIGFSPEMVEVIRARGFNNFSKAMSHIPMSIDRIEDDNVLSIGGRDWQVMVGRGHSPEHACLYCKDLDILISGDQVLPRITPHIGVYPAEPKANPLEKFIGSLDKFMALPADTLVLPAHNDVFTGLHNQLEYYASHHDERLDRLWTACEEPKSAVDLLGVLFDRELSQSDRGLGIAEGLAHCHYLVGKDRLGCVVGEDGIWRFQRTENIGRKVA